MVRGENCEIPHWRRFLLSKQAVGTRVLWASKFALSLGRRGRLGWGWVCVPRPKGGQPDPAEVARRAPGEPCGWAERFPMRRRRLESVGLWTWPCGSLEPQGPHIFYTHSSAGVKGLSFDGTLLSTLLWNPEKWPLPTEDGGQEGTVFWLKAPKDTYLGFSRQSSQCPVPTTSNAWAERLDAAPYYPLLQETNYRKFYRKPMILVGIWLVSCRISCWCL